MDIGRGAAPEILFVIGQLQIGGTEQHLLALAPALNALGHKTAVYSLAGTGPLLAEFERRGIAILMPPVNRGPEHVSFVTRMFRLTVSVIHLFSVLLRRRPAIVHFFLPSAYVTGAPLAILAGLPIRVMSRRSLNIYRLSRSLVWRLEQLLHGRMMTILGNSRSVVTELRDQEGVPESRLGLIYNGIDVRRFADVGSRTALRTKLGLAPSTLVLVIVANLIPNKGHRDLFEALGLAQRNLPADWTLLVVGEDYGTFGYLKAQVCDLKLEQKILFLGARSDVAKILLAGDIGLLCSHEEGFSNAILEGMAAGLPMIVTAVGGNPEAVLHEVTGIVVPPRDPPRLAEAILRLAGDPALRAQFGTAGRGRVAENFSLERMVASYDALYRALLAGQTPQDVPQLRIGNAP